MLETRDGAENGRLCVILRRSRVGDDALERAGDRLVAIRHQPEASFGGEARDGIDLVAEETEPGPTAGGTWMAYHGDEPVGVLRIQQHGSTLAEIQVLRVHAKWLMTGLGAALVRYAMARCTAYGPWRVMIGPDADLDSVRRLAGALGWQCLFPPDQNVAESLRRRSRGRDQADGLRSYMRRRRDPGVGQIVTPRSAQGSF